MARILSRPMFRKGGLSQAPRPSYRGGGVTAIRPRYKQGGRMTGIMSGIVDRKPYAEGSMWNPLNWFRKGAEMLRGKPPSYGDWLKQQIAKTGQTTEGRIASKAKNLIKRGWNLFPEEGLGSLAMRHFPKTTGAAATVAPLAGTVGGLSYMNWPVYPKGHPNEGEFVSKKEAAEIFEKAGDAGTAGDIAGEAAIFDDSLPEESGGKMDAYGNLVYPTKFNWEKPEVVEVAKDELGLLPKDKEKPNLTTGNDLNTQVTGDVESDLMRAYKEYAPIFEKELGVSPDDTKKQLWMQLAKFGTGLMAQPGGDLVGAVGKAAEKPLEGAGEVVKEVSTAKRQAKLLALQTAIREGEPGQIGKAVKDIAKIYNVSQKDAAAIYEKWQRNDTTARAATNKRYAEQAKQLGLVHDNQNRFIAEANQLETGYPELIGQFNNKLPEDTDKWELGYYVSDTGKFVRVVEKDGKKVAIGMDEPGFSDKKKTKK